MTKPPSERIRLLHEKLDKYKDAILKEVSEGKSITSLATKYDFRAPTLCDYVYLWLNGIPRRKAYRIGIERKRRGVRKFKKKKFSKELKNQMKINSEFNKRLIKNYNWGKK